MLKKFLLTGVGLVLIGAARFAFNQTAIAKFGEEENGRLNVALSLALLGSLPAFTTFGPATVRFVARARGRGDRARAAWIARRLTELSAAIALATAFGMWMFRDPIGERMGIGPALVDRAALVMFGYAAYQQIRNVLYAADRVGAYAILEVVAGLVFFAALGTAVLFGDAHDLLYAFAASYLAFFAAAAFHLRRDLSGALPIERAELGPIASFSAMAFVATTASMGVRELAVLVAPEAAGLEGASRLGWCIGFLTPLQFVPRMVRPVIFAESAERSDTAEDSAEVGRSVGKVTHWLLLLTVPGTFILALIAAPLIETLTGSIDQDFVLAFQLLAASTAIDIVIAPAASAVSGSGLVRANMIASIAGLIAGVAVWAAATRSAGVLGPALGLLVASVVRGAIAVRAAQVALRMPMTRTRSAAVALAGGAVGLALLVAIAAGVLVRR